MASRDSRRLVWAEAAQWAVEQWTDFPVMQDPRPLVFTGPIVLPQRGFRTGEAKGAFVGGDIEVNGPVPDEVVALLHSAVLSRPHPGSSVGPLLLTGGRYSEAQFSTDRGPRLLPAWRFDSEQLIDGLVVLDPETARRQWKRPDPPTRPAPTCAGALWSLGSKIENDDRTLHFEFTGGNPAWVDYLDNEVVETAEAIAVIPVETDHGPHGPRIALGYRRESIVHLSSGLGQRVLVNLDANPVPVTT